MKIFTRLIIFILLINMAYADEMKKEKSSSSTKYENALGLLRIYNYVDAEKILIDISQKDTSANYLDSCFMLGQMYCHGRQGIDKNYDKAGKYFYKAFQKVLPMAEENDAKAQYIVGVFYHDMKHDRKTAFEWILKSAENNYPEAQAKAGLHLFKGMGTAQNATEALKWLQKSVENNSMKGKAYLASYYLAKNKNIKEAIKLTQESSDAGNAAGQYTLGMAYQLGIGVPKDLRKAVELFRLAADQGQEDAIVRLKWSEKLLDKQDSKKAK